MSSNSKWKDRLLSSSVPLEFDAAKILVDKGFTVDFDYTYRRYDNKEEKDFSADISADAFYPFDFDAPIHLTVDLLVECKYRNPNVKWIFLPDINTDQYHSRFSSRTALKLVDEFSNECFESRLGFLSEHETCLKGSELNLQTGEVHDSDIRHGCNQLLYAMPHLLQRKISSALHNAIDECYPFVICPILLTTAELYIVSAEFGISKVLNSAKLEELCYKVDCIKYQLSIPPSFHFHCANTFRDIFNDGFSFTGESKHDTNYAHFVNLRKTTKEDISKTNFIRSDPRILLTELQNGYADDFFKEIIICSMPYFSKLIDRTKEYIEVLDSRKMTLQQ